MEAIFSLPYPEFAIATILQKNFKKKDGFSIQIPLSRQQKGLDLLVYNQKSKKAISIQVKSSRNYKQKEGAEFQYCSWFRKFEYTKGLNDYYVFFILYEKNLKKRLDRVKPNKWWWDKILIFNDKEMKHILDNIRTKKGSPEHFFAIGFNEGSKGVFITRGFPVPRKVTGNLIEKKKLEILKKLR